jgi:hypothetical protein
MRIWHWFVVVAIVALDLASMRASSWFFFVHGIIQHLATLIPAILVPLVFRSRFTHSKAGVILISSAAFLTSLFIPGVTGHGQYFPGAPWHTLITSSNGWAAILSPLFVSFMLSVLVLTLSHKRLQYRKMMKAHNLAIHALILQQQTELEINGAITDEDSPPIRFDPAQS